MDGAVCPMQLWRLFPRVCGASTGGERRLSGHADTLKDEAAKQMPDAGKLKRWGSRLVELGRELGIRVATSEITTVLHNIFGGD
jgi:hypothetical protein